MKQVDMVRYETDSFYRHTVFTTCQRMESALLSLGADAVASKYLDVVAVKRSDGVHVLINPSFIQVTNDGKTNIMYHDVMGNLLTMGLGPEALEQITSVMANRNSVSYEEIATGTSTMWDFDQPSVWQVTIDQTLNDKPLKVCNISCSIWDVTFEITQLGKLNTLKYFLEHVRRLPLTKWNEKVHSLTVGSFADKPVRFVWDIEHKNYIIILEDDFNAQRFVIPSNAVPHLVNALADLCGEKGTDE